MSAPKYSNDPHTGNFKGLSVILLIVGIIGGRLLYATRFPARPAAAQPTPQVQGESTAALDDYVAPEDVKPATTPTSDASQALYQVAKTVDGDTIKASIDGKVETIRLIGVDTPETKDPRKKVQCFGQAASDYTKANLAGKNVRLEADRSQDNRDKYGRLLRYVFLPDGTNFNLQLVQDGYAYEYTYDVPYQYQSQFKAAQTAAEAQSKGLWAASTCSGKR